MASQRRAVPAFLRPRYLLTAEVLLAIDLILRLLERALVASGWPPGIQVLLIMALVVGAFGSILLVIEHLAKRSLKASQEVLRGLPLPTPPLLVHLLVLVGLFVAYAWELALLESLWKGLRGS